MSTGFDVARHAARRVRIVSRDEIPTQPAAPTPDATWSYDQASVARFLEEVDGERTRLRAEIEAIKERMRSLDSAPAIPEAARELGAIVLAAHEELNQMEEEHRDAVLHLRADAAAEAEELIKAAQERAAAIYARAERLRAALDDQTQERHEAGGTGASSDVGER